MNWGRVLWVAGGFFVGSFPTTYVLLRAKRARAVLAAVDRRRSEGDAHVLMKAHLGRGWGSLAATIDVLKGFVYPLLARRYGGLPDAWLAATGIVLVTGYTFPFLARAAAGRGLAATSGVLLALLPVAMVVAGLIVVVGYAMRITGLASTVGFATAPLVALVQGQSTALVAMAGGLFGVILLRRLEGVSEAAARAGWGPALARRLLFDTDRPAREARVGEAQDVAPPA